MNLFFGHHDSGHAYKVALMLAVADIPHEYRWIDIWQPRESRDNDFQRYARYGEVPVWVESSDADSSREIYVQSNAILLHLAKQTGSWGADDPRILSRCLEWLVWEANKIGLCLPQLRSLQQFESDADFRSAAPWLQKRFVHDVGILDQTLADGRGFIIADTPTVADFSLCAYLFYADEAAVEVPERVGQWLNRISALPGWRPPYELLAQS